MQMRAITTCSNAHERDDDKLQGAPNSNTNSTYMVRLPYIILSSYIVICFIDQRFGYVYIDNRRDIPEMVSIIWTIGKLAKRRGALTELLLVVLFANARRAYAVDECHELQRKE